MIYGHIRIDQDRRAEMLLRSWLACMREPRPKDWEEIAANLMTDSQKFLDEKGRMVKAETEGRWG